MELNKKFKFLKEYNKFYLYGYMDKGKILYKECFSKQDIDGIPKNPKKDSENISKYRRI